MQNYISVNLTSESLKTSYTKMGDSSHPTLLFVHGNSSSKENFSKQIQSLKSSFHIIAVDLPGHGDTENLKSSPYSLELFSEFLIRFVQELDLEVYGLFGHSLGGHICIQALNRISPAKLILWGTPPMTNPPAMEKMFAPNPSAAFLFKDSISDEELQRLYNDCFVLRSSQSFLQYSKAFRKTDSKFRQSFFTEFSKLLYKDEFAEIEKFNGLILFLHGIEDKLINKGYLTENCFEHQIEFLESAGHFAHEDSSDDFTMKCLRFLVASKPQQTQSTELNY